MYDNRHHNNRGQSPHSNGNTSRSSTPSLNGEGAERDFLLRNKIRNVQLMSVDDPRFVHLRNLERYQDCRSYQIRSETPHLDPTYLLSSKVEEITRTWAEQGNPSGSLRGLSYQKLEQVRGGRPEYRPHTFEIDAVAMEGGTPLCFFEVKFTDSRKEHNKGKGQIRTNVTVARTIWKELGGCLIVVSAIIKEPYSVPDGLLDAEGRLDLSNVIKAYSGAEVPKVVLPFQQICDLGVGFGLDLDADLKERVIQRAKEKAIRENWRKD